MIKRVIVVIICYYIAFTIGAWIHFLPFYYGGGWDFYAMEIAYCAMLVVVFFTVIHSLPPIKEMKDDIQEEKNEENE